MCKTAEPCRSQLEPKCGGSAANRSKVGAHAGWRACPWMPPSSKAPQPRRERPRPRGPTEAPWFLVSPGGVLHVLEDEGAVSMLAKAEELGVPVLDEAGLKALLAQGEV